MQNSENEMPQNGDICIPDSSSNVPRKKQKNIKYAVLMLFTAVIFTAFGAAITLLLLVFGDRADGSDALEIIAEAYETIESRFVGDYDEDTIKDEAIEGLVEGLGDRWSRYMTADEAAEYELDQQNVIVGIGVTVSKADGSGMLVETVYAGGGAEAAGIQPGDVLVAADGVDLVPLTMDEGKLYVGGEEGTFVMLTVLHPDGTREELSVERKVVFIPPVSSRMIGNVGYIKLDNFDDGAADAFEEAIDELIEEGAAAFIFDVRNNGGGYVREMTTILDMLLPEGEIFVHRDSEGHETVTTSDKAFLDYPMAVLVNSSSYSAAEYFAAVLQEYDAALIVGEKTVGKGYSQQTISLSDGSALVLSTKIYCLPSRTSLAGVGITPDIEISLNEEAAYYLYYGTLEDDADLQLQAALEHVFKE